MENNLKLVRFFSFSFFFIVSFIKSLIYNI